MEYASKLLESAVNEIARLPGIGKRTSLRLALFLLKQPPEVTENLTSAINKLKNELSYCKECHNIADQEICEICSNHTRNKEILCVVEDIRDVMAIENTNQFNGLYHVLGGKISPLDGVGPGDLNINSLIEKVKSGKIKELVFALGSTLEGDTTNFYIFKQIQSCNILTTTIARGIAVGDELEFTDEITLGRSIKNRILFENSLKL